MTTLFESRAYRTRNLALAIGATTAIWPYLLVLTCLTLYCGRATAQVATQLPSMEGAVSAAVEAGTNPQRTNIPAAPTSTMVAHQFAEPQGYSGEGRGVAQTFGGERPMAVAESEIVVTASRDLGGGVNSNALADLIYYMRINERRTPPIVFQPRLRILAKTRGDAKAEASGRASAGATAQVQFGFVGRLFRAAANGQGTRTDGFNEQFIIDNLRPGDILPIRLTASVRSDGLLFSGEHNAEAEAMVDPQFSFDEVAFAEYAMQEGFAPFRQADYYEFEFSEGVLVPEPTTIVLAAICLAISIAWRCKSFARRRGLPP